MGDGAGLPAEASPAVQPAVPSATAPTAPTAPPARDPSPPRRRAPLAERLASTAPGVALRPHQVAALDALAARWAAGRRRALLVLPPAAGATVVGLEAARRLGQRVVVLAPDPAVQGQWVREWRRFGPPTVRAGTTADLAAEVTVLPVAALTASAPDDEVDEDGRATPPRPALALEDRLHLAGRALLRELAAAGPLTLLLDGADHLARAWGPLLGALLDRLPDARVIGLAVAAGASAATGEQALPLRDVLGDPVQVASLPGLVRDGALAPVADLAFLVAPTPAEHAWLVDDAAGFRALLADVLQPGSAPVPLLDWVAARCAGEAGPDDEDPRPVRAPGLGAGGGGARSGWERLVRAEPDLADAALRLHAAGHLALPEGARPGEEHRRPPSAADWVRLLDDWARHCLLPDDSPGARDAFDVLRAALPAAGWTMTRRGVREARTPADRVLARSEAKTDAVVEVLAAERAALGERLRALVVCDHERATATLPGTLAGVLSRQAGSARHVLERLVADPATAGLAPVLVTGRSVAAEAGTARALAAFVAERSPRTRLDPVPEGRDDPEGGDDGLGWDDPPAPRVVELGGDWTAREWVAHVTAFLDAGRTHVLVGTRGLLGEGWDARRLAVVVDLTTAASPSAAERVRGRALRPDPDRPGEVATAWSVVCATDDHPRGRSDWDRFVRRQDGAWGLDPGGEVVAGVARVHPALSPAGPPPVDAWPAVVAAMLARAADRGAVLAGWQVGSPYDDRAVTTLRVTGPDAVLRDRAPAPDDAAARGPRVDPPRVLPAATGVRRDPAVPDPRRGSPLAWAALAAGAGIPLLLGAPEASVPVAVAVGAPVQWTASTLRAGRLLRDGTAGPDVLAIARAVAEALREIGEMPLGAEAVTVARDGEGTLRVRLAGADPAGAAVFRGALAEALGPVGAPRYLLPRWSPAPVGATRREQRRAGRAWLARRLPPSVAVHHAVPAVLGRDVRRVTAAARAWSRWVSADAEPVLTATPEGAALLAACRGLAPLDVTTAVRTVWT